MLTRIAFEGWSCVTAILTRHDLWVVCIAIAFGTIFTDPPRYPVVHIESMRLPGISSTVLTVLSSEKSRSQHSNQIKQKSTHANNWTSPAPAIKNANVYVYSVLSKYSILPVLLVSALTFDRATRYASNRHTHTQTNYCMPWLRPSA